MAASDHPHQDERLMGELVPQSPDERNLSHESREVWARFAQVELAAARLARAQTGVVIACAERYAEAAVAFFSKVGR